MSDIIIRDEPSLHEMGDELTSKGVNIEYGLIPVDFCLLTDDKPLLIEYKRSFRDFTRSIGDKSLWRQIQVMKEGTDLDKCYILMDGNYAQATWGKGWGRESIIGTLRSIEKQGVKFYNFPSLLWSRDWLVQEVKKYKGLEKKRGFTLRSSASRKLSPEKQAEYLLEGFPEMGKVRFEEVKAKTGNANEFIEWVQGRREVDFSTRLSNLRKEWQEIINEGWNK